MINIFINFICVIGLLFSMDLIRQDLKNPNYCPKFLKIPASYIVLMSFSIVLFSNTVLNNRSIYLVASFIGLFLGLWFSYHELKKTKKCPRFFRIPMCYVSALTFILLIIVNYPHLNANAF